MNTPEFRSVTIKQAQLIAATATVKWAVKEQKVDEVTGVLVWVSDNYGPDAASAWFVDQVLPEFDADIQVWLLESLNAPSLEVDGAIAATSEMGGDR